MQIMTVKDVADFLRLKAATVCRLASEGTLPGVKVGKSWRFDRVALERLVTSAQSNMINGMDGRGCPKRTSKKKESDIPDSENAL